MHEGRLEINRLTGRLVIIDGRPSLQRMKFDGNSLLKASNIAKHIRICILIMVWDVTRLNSQFKC